MWPNTTRYIQHSEKRQVTNRLWNRSRKVVVVQPSEATYNQGQPQYHSQNDTRSKLSDRLQYSRAAHIQSRKLGKIADRFRNRAREFVIIEPSGMPIVQSVNSWHQYHHRTMVSCVAYKYSRFDSLPSDCGIGPVRLFECSFLCRFNA
jgi:hypothetical protein